jgi:CRISPR-associated protein Csd1
LGGGKPSFFYDSKNKKNELISGYESLLSSWCASEFSHPKAIAVLRYVRKKMLVADLVAAQILHLGVDGKLLSNWNGSLPVPEIFKVLTPDSKTKQRDQGSAFVRWRVIEPGNMCSAVWEDVSLQESWEKFDALSRNTLGVCMVTGEMMAKLETSHPKRIRHSGDGAKLISANDSSGYTFRGRFTDDSGQQASGVSYVVTQKAHNALRWLIERQAYRNDDQIFVSWAVSGKQIPDPFADSLKLLFPDNGSNDYPPLSDNPADSDLGQGFANRLNRAIASCRLKLGSTDDIVVMGLDSATPGRLAVTYYRELTCSEFLSRLEKWHLVFAWPQTVSRDLQFIGTPSVRDIAEVAYATRLGEKAELKVDERLRKIVSERLLPCILDGRPIPIDIVTAAIRKVSNRTAFKKDRDGKQWEWQRFLGIACALFKGANINKEYKMSYETERTSRDYLYGCLLAIAEHIESRAIYISGEKRETTAAKLMQRFADRPASTWRTIELALSPAKSRLLTKRGAFMHEMNQLLHATVSRFEADDFLDDRKLTGEFLLGYHCQMRVLNAPSSEKENASDDTTNE